MFRTTHIRTKLAVALAIPLAALVAVAGFEVVSASRDVDATRSQTSLATSAIGPGSLVVRLQDERNRASIDLIGLGDAAGLPVDTNEEARGLVDEAVAALQAELAGQSDDVKATFALAFEALEGLDALRADIDAYDGPMDVSNDELADEVFGRYTDIVESFFDATSTISLAVDDAQLRNGVELIDNATRQSEMRARIVRRVVLAVVTGETGPAAGQDIAALADRGHRFDADIRTHAVGPYEGVEEATYAEEGVQSFDAQVSAYLAGQDVNIGTMLEAVSSADPTTGFLGLRDRASDRLLAEADRIEDDAVTRQQGFAAIALGALLLALLVTWVASRSITRPLRSLKVQAEAMAGSKLPAAVRQILETPIGEDVVIPEMAPIEVRSRDEVAEVAGALSAVQTSALDLAVEQAVLRRNISDSYINLGRRNQNLLSRQLDFITELERNEADPDTLEGLFRLDHLATRMRRNAESLLVLAGVEPPRQWSAPVKVSDVVRAALGEVEDYQRVIVRHLEPASVVGSVASDVAHVVAELLENALSFSPPEQSVEIRGRLMTTGYTLAINDNGLGMSAEEIERANRRLAGEESFTVAPSRYLGHYVAGHLASRMGVTVELQDSPAGGVTARIDIPMENLANEETDPHLAPAQASAPVPSSTPAVEVDVRPEPLPAPAPTPAPTALSSHTESGLPRRGDRSPAAPSLVVPPSAETSPAPTRTEPTITGAERVPAPEAPAPIRADAATPAGLVRRVPGAQRPDSPLGARSAAPASVSPAAETKTNPEDVYSFLSNFQSGVARGRADAQTTTDRAPEDER